jgi:hypothetical protein
MTTLFAELALWARAMPAYAAELCAVATGALSVLDDRCAALMDGVLQQERSLAELHERRGVEENVAAEPAARFVAAEDLFGDPFRTAADSATDVILRAVLDSVDSSAPMRLQVYP